MAVQGVEGTSVEAVLHAAGAGKSQLYHYFRDKQGLVRAVVEYRFTTTVLANVARISSVDSWADLRVWFTELVDVQRQLDCRIGCPVGSLAMELSDHDERARQGLAAAFERWESEIRAMLERFRGRGLLRHDADTETLATATLASIEGGLLLSKTFHAPDRLRRTLDEAYRHLRSHRPASE